MTPLSTFVSIPLPFLTAMSLLGCYDLSTDGPHRDDFVRPAKVDIANEGKEASAGAEVRCGEVAPLSDGDLERTSRIARGDQEERVLLDAWSKVSRQTPDADAD